MSYSRTLRCYVVWLTPTLSNPRIARRTRLPPTCLARACFARDLRVPRSPLTFPRMNTSLAFVLAIAALMSVLLPGCQTMDAVHHLRGPSPIYQVDVHGTANPGEIAYRVRYGHPPPMD